MTVDLCHGISTNGRKSYVCVYGFFAFEILMLEKIQSQDLNWGAGEMEQQCARVMDWDML